MQPHLEWLRTLSWVSRAERVLLIAVIAISILAAVAISLTTTWQAGLFAGAGHLLLLAPAMVVPRRRLSFTALGLLALSAINILAAALVKFPSLPMISAVYLGLGLFGLSPAIGIWRQRMDQWKRVADYQTRDDFRWLLTEAPLLLRLRLAKVLIEISLSR